LDIVFDSIWQIRSRGHAVEPADLVQRAGLPTLSTTTASAVRRYGTCTSLSCCALCAPARRRLPA